MKVSHYGLMYLCFFRCKQGHRGSVPPTNVERLAAYRERIPPSLDNGRTWPDERLAAKSDNVLHLKRATR